MAVVRNRTQATIVLPERTQDAMRPEHTGIVQRLREELRVTETDTDALPKRWVELILELNKRERASRENDQRDRPTGRDSAN